MKQTNTLAKIKKEAQAKGKKEAAELVKAAKEEMKKPGPVATHKVPAPAPKAVKETKKRKPFKSETPAGIELSKICAKNDCTIFAIAKFLKMPGPQLYTIAKQKSITDNSRKLLDRAKKFSPAKA